MKEKETELLDEITMADLYSPYKEVAELIGLEAYMKLVREYGGGAKMYIPTLKSFRIIVRNRKICNEYDGRNLKSLAKKYGITTITTRKILREGNKY